MEAAPSLPKAPPIPARQLSKASAPPDVDGLLSQLQKGLLLDEAVVQWICSTSIDLLSRENNVLTLDSPITVSHTIRHPLPSTHALTRSTTTPHHAPRPVSPTPTTGVR